MRVRVKLYGVWVREGYASVPSPQPLSRWERGLLVLLPSGEGAPKGADEGTGEALWSLGA
ncbi:hypothetical protein XHC_4252 [Xanthomonas hortorum pv. carotae str. M081]|nr:hypothetical protein XHC_4252 [Xanthomonas hortorum pv. carotae str. M081]